MKLKSRAFTPGLAVVENKTVRKVRELPILGTLNVTVGSEVVGTEIVASAQLPGDMHILRLPERMGLEVFEVTQALKIKVGDHVQAGQLIAEHKAFFGLLKTRFFAPVSGTIELISEKTGHVGLRMPSEPLNLLAHISGRVVETVSGKSVIIETDAAFIQGIFGVGGERRGLLQVITGDAESRVEATDVPQHCHGAILIGRASVSLGALKLAAERGAVGYVTGAIDDQVLAGYLGYELGIALTGDENVPMSVIVTEGFGHLPIAERTMRILSLLEGREASINGATQVRAGALRPEIIVAHTAGAAREFDVQSSTTSPGLEIGSRIRIIRVPYFGMRAKVIELPKHEQVIETGASTRVLKAQLDSGLEVVVPRANVELMDS